MHAIALSDRTHHTAHVVAAVEQYQTKQLPWAKLSTSTLCMRKTTMHEAFASMHPANSMHLSDLLCKVATAFQHGCLY
jgi:hypothetical protein